MATLMACDRLFGTRLEPAELAAMGAQLGSDVPFFLAGATALGRGLGTDLTPLPAIRVGHFLVMKPNFDLATAAVYTGLKMGLTVRTTVANIRVIKPLIARFPSGTWFGYNRLEEVVLPAYPELQRALAHLREAAPVAMMTGSGSALYGVFLEEGTAEHMASRIQSDFPFIRCVLPHPAGVQFLEE
jgi:4-diphosphocytidyl-2-C-methyl-D-erythritol kinase